MEIKITGVDELISKVDLVQEKLDEIIRSSSDKWLDNEEFVQYLKISKKTSQNYRDLGLIKFSQIGKKIYYQRSEIDRFLERHSVHSLLKR